MRMSHATAAPHFLQIDDSLSPSARGAEHLSNDSARRYVGTSSLGRKQLLARK